MRPPRSTIQHNPTSALGWPAWLSGVLTVISGWAAGGWDPAERRRRGRAAGAVLGLRAVQVRLPREARLDGEEAGSTEPQRLDAYGLDRLAAEVGVHADRIVGVYAEAGLPGELAELIDDCRDRLGAARAALAADGQVTPDGVGDPEPQRVGGERVADRDLGDAGHDA
ncbi:MAG: hypothetical protein AAF823_09035 [Planctomycetota bacterium]